MTHRVGTYAEFWPYYLGEHRRPATRIWHFIGTTLGLSALTMALVTTDPLWALVALIGGYGPAWVSHAVIERNRPATFRYPLWSLASDLRMAALMAVRRLDREYERYHIGQDPS